LANHSARYIFTSSSHIIKIGEYSKEIKGHLRSYKVADASLDSEAKLLLARAGNCTVEKFGFLLL